MYYDINNILKIQNAIDFLKEVDYYDYDIDSPETELARDIVYILDCLDKLIKNAKKYERELYCELNNISCKTCKHNGCQSSEWICEMCDAEMLCGNWEKGI